MTGTNLAKNRSACRFALTGRAWTGAALRPAAGDLVLLADTSLICEPDFYRVDADRLLTRDCVQARGEAFLKSSEPHVRAQVFRLLQKG